MLQLEPARLTALCFQRSELNYDEPLSTFAVVRVERGLTALGFQRLKRNYDEPLPNFAFSCKVLRPYSTGGKKKLSSRLTSACSLI